jgi:hypothetical protein
MYKTALFLVLLWTSVAAAEVVNVEFKFTPYVGDPATANQVETVPGTAKVFLNNVLFAEQEVRTDTVPVLFEEREIAASVWVPASSLGAALRKGKNAIRIEFQPADAKQPYHARLSWASVMDQATEQIGEGSYKGTNMSMQGQEDKKTTGAVVLQREFVADFAPDLPWHHYPATTALSDDDKKSLAQMVRKRAEGFKPDFAPVYDLLGKTPGLDIAAIRQAKCLDQAYAVGIRIATPEPKQLEFTTTGNPEVVVTRTGAAPLYDFDGEAISRIKGDDLQMCAGVALTVAFPSRLVVVRSPAGTWDVAY